MRTIIDLPEEQLAALDAWCGRDGISRAEGVRRAVAAYVRQVRASAPDPAFGLWRGRVPDGLTYQRRARSEWDARTRSGNP
jgi:hypothetical protein